MPFWSLVIPIWPGRHTWGLGLTCEGWNSKRAGVGDVPSEEGARGEQDALRNCDLHLGTRSGISVEAQRFSVVDLHDSLYIAHPVYRSIGAP